MANLTLSFAAVLTFMWAADFKSVVESPRMESVSTLAQNSTGSVASSVPYLSKVVVRSTVQKETKTIVPGGEIQFANGVVIRAPEGELRTSIQISVEQIPLSQLPEPVPPDFETIGPIYLIKASSSPSQTTNIYLEFGFPYPSEFRGQNFFAASLVPRSAITDGDSSEGYEWAASNPSGLDQDRLFSGSGGIDDDEGVIFALFKRKAVSELDSRFTYYPSVPYVGKVSSQENSSTSGILMPGGSWTSKDGVRIVAPVGSISSPVTISVTKRNEPAESFGLLPSIYEVVAIYEVTSNPIAGTDSEDLQLYFPVPNVADLQQYALLRLNYQDAIPSLSGSGIISWTNKAYNAEKLTEIKQEQNTIDVDHFMIAKSTFPQVVLNSLPKNTTNGQDSQPK
jgi:hypothetical protein